MITDEMLIAAVKKAAKNAFTSLFETHSDDEFYYCSLITDGVANAPFISAWSKQALEKICAEDDDPEEAREDYKWSYADSPFCDYGEEYFVEVKKIFDDRDRIFNIDALSESEWESEFNFRLRVMEAVMKSLDSDGMFGTDDKRKNIFINAEVMPPDCSNTERAIRLNPANALIEWLKEAAEDEDDD